MKKNIVKKIVCGCLMVALVAGSFGLNGSVAKAASNKTPKKPTFYYSNLADKKSRAKLDKLMDQAGIYSKRQDIFWAHVNQFNKAVPKKMLVQTMTKYDPNKPKYDSYDMQEKWQKKYPDYLGQNCRLTSYTLMGNQIDVKNKNIIRGRLLMFDKDAAATDPWVKQNKIKKRWWLKDFVKTYSYVPTKATKNVKTHVAAVEKDWKKRGITFKKNSKASVINIFFHDNIDGNNIFVGHTGVLFTDKDDLWFLEKIAFQEPYQLIKFKNRSQLNYYLMDKYDVEEGQPTAAPFIMENGHLMKGYKVIR